MRDGVIPTVVRDRRVPPTDPHWHLFERLPGPDLPAREPGETIEDYRARLAGYHEKWSGRRARPHAHARLNTRAGSRGSMSG